MDLIDRQAAIDLVRDICNAIMCECESHYDDEVGDEVYEDAREVDAILKCNKEIRKALRNMPSAQPERKKAMWRKVQIGHWHGFECTACKIMQDGRLIPCDNGGKPQLKFCPECGADMKGEDHETD